MRKRIVPCLWLASIAVAGQLSIASGETEEESSQSAAWAKFYGDQATGYEFSLAGAEKITPALQPKAILTYTNPVRLREQHGAVFVWTHQGRPEVIGTIWSKLTADASRRRVAHEFHSLSAHAVEGKREGRPFWQCEKAGVEMRPIPGAPAVERTARARQLQLRAVAKEFSATAEGGEGEGRQTLRLLPQPLFQYEAADAGVSQGGIFAFVLATDPELFLLIEARDTKTKPAWHFAACRFTTLSLQLTHNEREVWQCSARATGDPDDAYLYNPQVFLRAASIDDEAQ
jgi:hypothetical protein